MPGVALVNANQPTNIRVSTSPVGETKTVTYQIMATSGIDTSVAFLQVTLNNPFPTGNNALPRTTFTRTDYGVNQAIYDPTRRLVFATVHDLNRVEVFESDGRRRTAITVPRPYGIDQAPDGRILVGTRSAAAFVIDPNSLEVVDRVVMPKPPQGPSVSFSLRPVVVKAASNDTALILASVGNTSGTQLLKWDLANGTIASFQPLPSTPESMTRSGDYSTILLGGSSLAIYDTATDSITATLNTGGVWPDMALNHDGSQVSAADTVYSRSLAVIRSGLLSTTWHGRVFSRDGRFLYIGTTVTASTEAEAMLVYETQNFNLIGLIPSVFIDTGTVPLDVDEFGTVFAGTEHGLAFLDASAPRALAYVPPTGRRPNSMDPPSGTLTNPAQTTVNGAGLGIGAQVFFGDPRTGALAGSNVSVASTNVINVTPPNANSPGPVHVTVTQPGGWAALIPDAYTYGPHALWLENSAGTPAGGTNVRLYGYGFQYPSSQISVMVGGRVATVHTVFAFAGFSPFPFPVHNIEFTTPSGTPGWADIVITTPAGSTTIPRGFQYLSVGQVYPIAGAIGQVIYDKARARLFATNLARNQVEVFSIASASLLAPIPAGPVPDGIALTSDGARLAVGNFGNGTITVVDPDNPSTTVTGSVMDPSDVSCRAFLGMLVPVKPRRILFQTTCRDVISGRFQLLDAATMTTGCGVSSACSSFLQRTGSFGFGNVAASASGGKLVFGTSPGNVDSTISLWDTDADTIISNRVGGGWSDAAAAMNGNRFAGFFNLVNRDLEEDGFVSDVQHLRIDLNLLFGQKLHPSGSLLYFPYRDGVGIFDVGSRRLAMRIGAPETLPATIDSMAIDEHGKRIFLVSQNGITILELNQVPLSIGYASPAQGPSAGGSTVTIRGSGFQQGATVKFGSVTVTATFLDESTLSVTAPSLPPGPVTLTVTNPDGRNYRLDNMFRFN